MSEVEYYIWHPIHGQMDTSTKWGKIYALLSRAPHFYNKLYIIPTNMVGKGKYRTLKQIQDNIKKLEIIHNKLMKNR
nr:MAG: hypothetical protein [uncultured archaeon]